MQAFYRAGVNKREGGVCRHSLELVLRNLRVSNAGILLSLMTKLELTNLRVVYAGIL